MTQTQRYFQLFPTANLMMPIANHSLVLGYSRLIRRPTFGNLNPYRLPLSEYAFVEGNPQLRAALSHDYSVGLALFNRYNLTLGVTDTKGAFHRISTTDADLPGVMILRVDNVARNTTYYLSANIPLNPVSWWQMNVNLSGRRDDVDVFDEKRTVYTFQGFMAHSFLFPRGYSLDVNGLYLSPFLEGNVKTQIGYQVNAAVRRQFFKDRITASFLVNNIFNSAVARLYVDEADFHRYVRSRYGFREFGLSLRYSFSTGKATGVKKIETGAADEKARLQ
jgi:hypothetical protein